MALVSWLVGVGAAVLLSVVCCSLFAVCCLLLTFVICSLFVRCLFTLCTLSFRSLFVLCSLSVCCRHLFASCMPAAVGRKIKYRFHAWQAPEVFSKRQPLIFRYYLCICGSFFPHVCVAFMCVLHQYSCLRPSGRCRVKRPFSTTFSNSLWADLPQVSLSPALPGTPSGRCRRKCRLPVTFLFRYVASPHSFGKGGEIPAFPYSFGRGRVKDVVYRPSSEVMRSGRRPVGP